jgi:hypothetical protein
MLVGGQVAVYTLELLSQQRKLEAYGSFVAHYAAWSTCPHLFLPLQLEVVTKLFLDHNSNMQPPHGLLGSQKIPLAMLN